VQEDCSGSVSSQVVAKVSYAILDVSMVLNVVSCPCGASAMPAATACPTPTAPPAAGPAPATAAGANPPPGLSTPSLASASAAATASLTDCALARVAAPPALRDRVASHPRPAVLPSPHHRVPAQASARCTSTIDLVGTADVAATARNPPV